MAIGHGPHHRKMMSAGGEGREGRQKTEGMSSPLSSPPFLPVPSLPERYFSPFQRFGRITMLTTAATAAAATAAITIMISVFPPKRSSPPDDPPPVVTAAGATTTVIVLLTGPPVPLAVTVKVDVPAVSGVPDTTPPGDKVNPLGNEPVDVHVTAPVRPSAVSVWLYAVPTIPAPNSDPDDIAGMGVTGVEGAAAM